MAKGKYEFYDILDDIQYVICLVSSCKEYNCSRKTKIGSCSFVDGSHVPGNGGGSKKCYIR